MVAGTQLDGTFRRRDSSGHDVGAFCFVGAFAEATVVDQASVVTVDRDIPFEVVALAACGVTGGFGAVLHAVRVRPGDAVLIVGAGGTGISAVQAARASGARQIIVADTQEWKLSQAKDFGATDAILVGEPHHLADEVLKLTASGVEFAFVCIGVAEVLEQAVRATAVGGTVVITALIMSTDATSALDPLALQLGQKTVIGSQYGSLSQRYGIPETLRHYQNGSLRIAEMVSRTYRLDEISSGFEDLAAGRNVRGLVRFN